MSGNVDRESEDKKRLWAQHWDLWIAFRSAMNRTKMLSEQPAKLEAELSDEEN